MKKWSLWLLIIGVFAVFPLTGSAEEKPPFFTNEDVNKYKKSSDAQPSVPKKDIKEEPKAAATMAKDKKEQESWCKQANDRRKKIEKAQYDVNKAEKNLLREKEKSSSSSKKTSSCRIVLTRQSVGSALKKENCMTLRTKPIERECRQAG